MIPTSPNEEIRNFLSAKQKEVQDAVHTLVTDPSAEQVDILTNLGCTIEIHRRNTPTGSIILNITAALYNNHSKQCEAHSFFTYDPDYDNCQAIVDWCIAKLVDYIMRG